ncbi:murein transglycosylase [Rhodococcus hoagii]|nr:murein transglycosylase [Prescottella equi]NKS72194.1 murein transglycosylase [Prescottella equi]
MNRRTGPGETPIATARQFKTIVGTIATALSVTAVVGCSGPVGGAEPVAQAAAEVTSPGASIADPEPSSIGLPDDIYSWAGGLSATVGISIPALAAYGNAAAELAQTQPSCGIGWTTLAGIGMVETLHGTHGGSAIGRDGVVRPPIRGLALDGRPGLDHLPDTDRGALDGDPTFDRAMGPMQFIPDTWRRWGTDADHDGKADPDNIYDAALSAARYLCASGLDLSTVDGWSNALLSYNYSAAYVANVNAAAVEYAARAGE